MKTIVAFLYFLFVFALNAQTIYPLKEATHLLFEDDFITPIKQVDSLYKGVAIKMMRTHSFVDDIVYTKELITGLLLNCVSSPKTTFFILFSIGSISLKNLQIIFMIKL